MKSFFKRKAVVLTTLSLGSFCYINTAQCQDTAVLWADHFGVKPLQGTITTSVTPDSATMASIEIQATDFINSPNGSMALLLEVPPENSILGVRICSTPGDINSDIVGVHLKQGAVEQSYDLTLVSAISGCRDQTVYSIAPGDGPVALILDAGFMDGGDTIKLNGIGLHVVNTEINELKGQMTQMQQDIGTQIDLLTLELDELDSALQKLEDDFAVHTHTYLTGKGVGHNNVVATSSIATVPELNSGEDITPATTPSPPQIPQAVVPVAPKKVKFRFFR